MKNFLRIEALSILLGVIGLNAYLGRGPAGWWLFVLFAVLPEITWLAYLKRDGTAWWPNLIYNIAHMYAVPIFLTAALWPVLNHPIYLLGWVANIAFWRVWGLGFRGPKTAAKPAKPAA
jgi:Domain of unknown function (DUF4260)